MNNLENALYKRYQDLDEDVQSAVLSCLFARMRYLKNHGTGPDREMAERFFMEMEHCIEQQEKFFGKKARV